MKGFPSLRTRPLSCKLFITRAVCSLLIRERGSVTSRDVSRSLGLSREHTARVMKSLHERGLVLREGKPFKYSLTPQGERVLREGSG